MLSLVFAWINGWVNNHEAGDLRRHRAHYDAKVMTRHQQPTAYLAPPASVREAFIEDSANTGQISFNVLNFL